MFKPVYFDKASIQIISQIRGLILAGKLCPGDRLAPESILAEQFGVSRQTLKEALRTLEYMGLVKIKKGVSGGAYVMEMDKEIMREVLASFLFFKNLTIQNLSEVRKIVEPYTARVAAERMSEKDLEKIGMLLREDRLQVIRYDAKDRKIDMDFHRSIAGATGNPILELVVDFIETVMMDLKSVIKPSTSFSTIVLEGHKKIYKALRDKNPVKASEEMQNHLIEVENYLAASEKNAVILEAALNIKK